MNRDEPGKTGIDHADQKLRTVLRMTILQFDSEDLLCHIIEHIPKEIQVVVGGPMFNMMDKEDLSKKSYVVLNTISSYLDFLLTWQHQ